MFCFYLVGAGLAYCIVVTLRISKGGKCLVVVFLLHFTVLHLLLDNGLKHTSVDCVKALWTETYTWLKISTLLLKVELVFVVKQTNILQAS